jgi:hypothetical protein
VDSAVGKMGGRRWREEVKGSDMEGGVRYLSRSRLGRGLGLKTPLTDATGQCELAPGLGQQQVFLGEAFFYLQSWAWTWTWTYHALPPSTDTWARPGKW